MRAAVLIFDRERVENGLLGVGLGSYERSCEHESGSREPAAQSQVRLRMS